MLRYGFSSLLLLGIQALGVASNRQRPDAFLSTFDPSIRELGAMDNWTLVQWYGTLGVNSVELGRIVHNRQADSRQGDFTGVCIFYRKPTNSAKFELPTEPEKTFEVIPNDHIVLVSIHENCTTVFTTAV